MPICVALISDGIMPVNGYRIFCCIYNITLLDAVINNKSNYKLSNFIIQTFSYAYIYTLILIWEFSFPNYYFYFLIVLPLLESSKKNSKISIERERED